MNFEISQEEIEFLEKIFYNESIKNHYLLSVDKIKEFPKELLSLIDKIKNKESEDEN